MRTAIARSLLVSFLVLAACSSTRTTSDPPAFEDLVAEVNLEQQAAFDALLASVQAHGDTTVEELDRPSTFRSRRGRDPAIAYRVKASFPASRSVVAVRRSISSTDVAELRRWLRLVYGDKLTEEPRQVAIEEPRASVPSASTYAPTRASTSSGGGPVQVRGYYRKDGTYVPPHTRRR